MPKHTITYVEVSITDPALWRRRGQSETVDLDVLLLQAEGLDHKLHDLQTLVTLQLDDLSELVVLDDVSVACKLLFDDLEDLLRVILRWKTLNRGQSLSTISLLDTDVNVVG